jgi:LAGLIDADG DNA endonuclease family
MGATKQSLNIKLQSLSNKEINFIQACLLGDGTLSKSGKHFRLRVAQKASHKQYVLWKYNNLQKLCVSKPTLDKVNNSFRFGTVGHPHVTGLQKLWYKPTKQIPEKFTLDSLALAIWFMDDGCRIHNTVNFSVHNFSSHSIALLQKQLLEMKIVTSVQSDGKGKRLYIKQNSYAIFERLVKPYIVKCMAYKLPITP